MTTTTYTAAANLDRDQLEALLAVARGETVAAPHRLAEAVPALQRAMDRLDPARQETCAERLPEHLAGRLADLRTMLDRDDPDEDPNPDDIDSPGPLYEYGLGSSVAFAVRVDLSTGGPADYITARVGSDGVEAATYHFADWFDHAERALDGDDLETVERWLSALSLDDPYTLGETLKGDGR